MFDEFFMKNLVRGPPIFCEAAQRTDTVTVAECCENVELPVIVTL
jgi:hypothetical protein